MERTKIYTALQGVRGQKPVDLAAMETLLVRFSQLLADFPEIKESDINPLLATPENITALDARVLLSKEGEELPWLALPVYPNQYTTRFRLKDGREVTLRVIRPEDGPLVIAMHATHSEQTIRMRYFSLVKTLSRDTLIRLCHLDYNREMALVAVLTENGQTKMVGVSRYYLHPESGDAEFAVIVNDAWQGQGLGQHLMQRLIAVARERGVRRLVGLVLAENNAMLNLMDELAFRREESGEQGVVKVTMAL
jgi:acetyltransferase